MPSDAALSRIAFATIVVGVAVLAVAVVVGGAVYPGYDHARQFMSELGAVGSATGGWVNPFGYIPNGVLMTAFCLMAAWILRRNVLAVLACLLMAGNGVGMWGAGVYPCDFECSREAPSTTALLHDLFGGLGYMCAIFGLLLTIVWSRKSVAPWLAPLSAVVLLVSIIGFGGVVTEVELKGLYQRAMETGLAIFLLALGWAILKGLRGAPS